MSQSEKELALIHAVVANPDDDMPRLAYAGWLEEQGREPRARLIRIQCQIEQLQAEERQLIERHGREWGLELLGAGADAWKFRRGFPEDVHMGIDDFMRTLERLNDVTPITHLHLLGGSDRNLYRLADLPAVHQIRSLEIDRPTNRPEVYHCGVAGVRALTASPNLTKLRQLTLHSHCLGSDGVKALAQAPTFAHLTHLTLSDPALLKLDNETMSRIIGAFPRLSELQIDDRIYGSNLLQALRSGTRIPRSDIPGPRF